MFEWITSIEAWIALGTLTLLEIVLGIDTSVSGVSSMGSFLFQIMVLDIVFSFDSVITAVGLAQQFSVMAIAIILSVCVMLVAARPIGSFVEAHPTI